MKIFEIFKPCAKGTRTGSEIIAHFRIFFFFPFFFENAKSPMFDPQNTMPFQIFKRDIPPHEDAPAYIYLFQIAYSINLRMNWIRLKDFLVISVINLSRNKNLLTSIVWLIVKNWHIDVNIVLESDFVGKKIS